MTAMICLMAPAKKKVIKWGHSCRLPALQSSWLMTIMVRLSFGRKSMTLCSPLNCPCLHMGLQNPEFLARRFTSNHRQCIHSPPVRSQSIWSFLSDLLVNDHNKMPWFVPAWIWVLVEGSFSWFFPFSFSRTSSCCLPSCCTCRGSFGVSPQRPTSLRIWNLSWKNLTRLTTEPSKLPTVAGTAMPET